jgi:hypothetical protein
VKNVLAQIAAVAENAVKTAFVPLAARVVRDILF